MSSIKIDADLVSRPAMPQSPNPQERRREARYVPLKDRAYLGWWEGEDFRTETGSLRNISSGGAAIRVANSTVPAQEIWLCVVGPSRLTWVGGGVKGHEEGIVRIAFHEAFPYELFKEVVWDCPTEKLFETDSESTGFLDLEPIPPA